MEGEQKDKIVKEGVVRKPTRPQPRKHMSSTFTPMIGSYMSDCELKLHVDHQLSLEQKKYFPEQEPILKEQEKSKKKKVKKKNFDMEEEDEKDEKKKEYREGYHDRMLEDLELLRDYYKRIYKRALNEKVSNQHREFKNQHDQAVANERRLKEKEEKERHKVIIRLPKSKVQNEQAYKKGLQETVYHKIIKLEYQFKKQGYLSKVSEIKTFWGFILVPGNLENLEKGKITWEDIMTYERNQSNAIMNNPEENLQKWTRSNVNKMMADNARPSWSSTRHTRAKLFTGFPEPAPVLNSNSILEPQEPNPSGLTDISSSQSGREQSPKTPPNKSKPVPKTLSNAPLTFEQKFPKVEFPPLAAFSLVFGEQEPDPEEIERELEIQRKEEAKRDTRDKLLTMFSHSLANRAATQRLIERNEEYGFDQLVDTSSVKELMYLEAERKVMIPLTTKTLQAHNRSSSEHKVKKKEKASCRKSSSKELARSLPLQDHDIDRERDVDLYRENKRLPPIDVPLTMQVLEQTYPVQEAKALSTLWVNPL